MPATPASPTRIPFWMLGALPVLLGAWLRLHQLDAAEPFIDEGANILTALDPRVAYAFEPMAQGRPALLWLFKPAGWLPEHALVIARMMAVGAGLVTTIALGWTLRQLADRVAALCGMFIWAVLPFAVFHERLALQDPFITALLSSSVALFTAATLRTRPRFIWPWFVAAGALFGWAFLLKISAALALPWLGIIYLAVQQHASRPWLSRHLAQLAIGALLPLACLGANWHSLGSKLDRYSALSLSSKADFLPALVDRVPIWLRFYAGYGGWPLGLTALLAVILTWRGRNQLAFTCATAWLLALVITGIFFNNTFARYALSDQLPLILFFALALARVRHAAAIQRISVFVLVTVALAGWSHTSWQIGSDPTRSAIPPSEIAQYYTGPWSGSGLAEIKKYLTDYADHHHVTCLVLTHHFLRPGCYGLMLSALGDPRIGVLPVTIYEIADLTTVRPALQRAAAGRPVAYFILYEGSLYPPQPWLAGASGPARQVVKARRNPDENFTLYQFEP